VYINVHRLAVPERDGWIEDNTSGIGDDFKVLLGCVHKMESICLRGLKEHE
jgi:hypothetical protein